MILDPVKKPNQLSQAEQFKANQARIAAALGMGRGRGRRPAARVDSPVNR